MPQRREEQLALGVRHRDADRQPHVIAVVGFGVGDIQRRLDIELHDVVRQHVTALHAVLELANVARPRVRCRHRQGAAVESLGGPVLPVELVQECVGEELNVPATAAQGRQADEEHG